MDALTLRQLDNNADEFVSAYRNASDEEISKIVAGMTAIIEGNEASYESMKSQRWFERIWYGLTGKNKATVREMQARRDQLTKYTVHILVKMNDMMNEHSRCIVDLYRSLAVVRRDLDVVVDEVSILAHKLNEKIMSVDNYNFLLNEIRNNKFDINSPLISLIDIMSLVDIRTAQETKKMIQLKETMEQMGFDFSKKVDIITFSNEVLSLPEESIGRVLVFCQSFSHRSRLLAYTCTLMESYFYLWDSEKRVVRENGEVIKKSIDYSNLSSGSQYVVEELFNDLNNAIRDSFEIVGMVETGNEIVSSDDEDTWTFVMPIDAIERKSDELLIVKGLISKGRISNGDIVQIIDKSSNRFFAEIDDLEFPDESLKMSAEEGEYVFITLFGVADKSINIGMSVISSLKIQEESPFSVSESLQRATGKLSEAMGQLHDTKENAAEFFNSPFQRTSVDSNEIKEKITLIVDKYIHSIPTSTYDSYDSDELRNASLIITNARSKYGYKATGSIIGIVDTSLFSNGKDGILFTTEGFAFKYIFDPSFIRYDEIWSVKYNKNGKELLVDGIFKGVKDSQYEYVVPSFDSLCFNLPYLKDMIEEILCLYK